MNSIKEKIIIDAKNKIKLLKLFTITCFTCFLLIFILLSFVPHEVVHKKIFKLYGIDSEIRIGFFELYTEPEENYNISVEDYKRMMELHLMNEIFMYNLTPILVLFLSIAIFTFSIYLEFVELNEKTNDLIMLVKNENENEK